MSVCECGCGSKTTIAARNDASKGWVKGRPLRFINGHHRRKSPVDFILDSDTGCWMWQLTLDANGYGRVRRGSRRLQLAHRYMYERHIGPIEPGLDLDHLCRTPRCVNPAHLEPVSRAENTRRGSRTKLTAEAVREIRESPEDGPTLARQFGVRKQTIYAIRSRRSWADLVDQRAA
jgi:hypothetical protein